MNYVELTDLGYHTDFPGLTSFPHGGCSDLTVHQVHRSILTERQQGENLSSAFALCHGQMTLLETGANSTTPTSTFARKI